MGMKMPGNIIGGNMRGAPPVDTGPPPVRGETDKDRIAAKIEKLQDESHVVKQLLASLQSTVRDAQKQYDENNKSVGGDHFFDEGERPRR